MTIELRAPKLEEAAAIAELANRASDELFGEREETEATARMWLAASSIACFTGAGTLRAAARISARVTSIEPVSRSNLRA